MLENKELKQQLDLQEQLVKLEKPENLENNDDLNILII